MAQQQNHPGTSNGSVGNIQLSDPDEELIRLRSFTLWQALNAAAESNPDNYAFIGASDSGEVSRIMYKALLTQIRNFSAGLASIGVRKGDRLAVWMTNTIEWAITVFAAMRIGAVVVPINTFLKPQEIKYFIEQSGARHLVMIDSFRKLQMPELLAEICPNLCNQKFPGFTFCESLPDLRNIVLFSRSGGSLDCAWDFKALCEPGDDALTLADCMEEAVTGADLGMIKYTSGSTAFPKGVMLEQGGFIANGILHGRQMAINSSDIYFSSMPFFHAGGSIYGMMSMLPVGGTLLFTEAFDPELAADLIVQEKATIQISLLANELIQVAQKKGYVFESIRLAGLPDDLSRKIMPNVSSCVSAYGLTETYAPVALSSHSPNEEFNGGAFLLPGNACRIVDPDTGKDLPPGTPGEAWLRGNLARGYWNKPAETAKAFDADGWFHSEDICVMDDQGRLKWVGRLKLMLKVGGENVSLEEIERLANTHDSILGSAAVGVPDKRKHEAVCLYIQLIEGHTPARKDLLEWFGKRLAHFKVPREIIVLQEIPYLSNGKIDRVTLGRLAKEQFPE